MTSADRLTVAAGLAVLLASSSLAQVYDGLGWLLPVALAVAAVAAAGALARRLRVPLLLRPLVGVAALAVCAALVSARSTFAFGLLPTRQTATQLRLLFREGLLDVGALATPVPANAGLVLLAVLGIGVVAIAVDLVAVSLVRPAAAGLLLLLLFAVPSATVAGGVGWWPFVLGAAGWLGLLLVESGDRRNRWGVPLSIGTRGPAYDPGLSRVGRRIGAAALGVAVLVPALIPGLDGRLSGGGDGFGLGGGSRTTTTYNPITQLADQLRLPTPTPLMSYRTDDPSPDYLRLTTLDLYDGAQWSSSELSGSREKDAVSRGIPEPVGVDFSGTRQVTTEIEVDGLDGPWLPVPFPPREIDLEGPWLWDAEAETVFSTRRRLQDVDGPYRVVTARADPSAAVLRAGGTLPSEIDVYATPPEVTDYVRQLTNEVVAGRTAGYDQVAALQAWFTDRSNGFRYSLDSTVPDTNSPDALENFLRGRQGFCEQYASAMAAMVRLLGLPARVGVGFTPGDAKGGGRYEVTTSDAHAWPEVWFLGTGWLRFEPTPRGEQVTTPGYTRPPVDDSGQPEQSAAPTQAPVPQPTGPDGQPLSPDGNQGLEGGGLTDADAGGADSGRSLLGVLALSLPVVALLLLAPLGLATLRRRLRWRTPSAELAWRQVQDDALDVGHPWRRTDSPRAAAAHLRASRDLELPAAEALDRLAQAAERSRYARPGTLSDDEGSSPALEADVRRLRAGLLAGAESRQRWTARLLPPSTVRWAGSAVGGAVADALDRLDELLAAAGRRLRRRPA